jgi:transcriptional regulator with XRE-family HTH domain
MTKSSKEIIGLMIKSRRLEKDFTQKQLADLLEVDRQYVWRLENGKVNLTMDYLDKVIYKLDCEQKDFIIVPVED